MSDNDGKLPVAELASVRADPCESVAKEVLRIS
jgi:hypothetical protein